MHFNSEDLLKFCAEYTLAKSAARLPLTTLNNKTNVDHQAKPKEFKTGRKKIQTVECKKAVKKVKPKLQQVKNKNQKKSLSPIEQKISQNKNYDLDYFMNQLSDRSFGQNFNKMQYGAHQQQNRSFCMKKLSMPTQNYETFGKSGEIHGKQFQIFGQKDQRQNIVNPQSAIRNKPLQSNQSQYSIAQKLKNFSENNSWLFENHKTRQIFNEQSQKASFSTFQNQNNQIKESKMNYSPSVRNYSPTPSSVLSSSWIKTSANNESNQCKSRVRHQRNKSEMPCYGTPKPTLTVENERYIETKQDQSLLSQSFVSIAENSNMVTNTKKQLAEQNKRETSTTVAPRKYSNIQSRNIQNLVSLNEFQGQNLMQLKLRPFNIRQIKI